MMNNPQAEAQEKIRYEVDSLISSYIPAKFQIEDIFERISSQVNDESVANFSSMLNRLASLKAITISLSEGPVKKVNSIALSRFVVTAKNKSTLSGILHATALFFISQNFVSELFFDNLKSLAKEHSWASTLRLAYLIERAEPFDFFEVQDELNDQLTSNPDDIRCTLALADLLSRDWKLDDNSYAYADRQESINLYLKLLNREKVSTTIKIRSAQQIIRLCTDDNVGNSGVQSLTSRFVYIASAVNTLLQTVSNIGKEGLPLEYMVDSMYYLSSAMTEVVKNAIAVTEKVYPMHELGGDAFRVKGESTISRLRSATESFRKLRE